MNERTEILSSKIRYANICGLCLQTTRYRMQTIQISYLNPSHVSDRSKILQIFTKDLYFDRKAIFW